MTNKAVFVPQQVTGKVGNTTVQIPITEDGTTKNMTRYSLGKNDAGANGSIYVKKNGK